MKLQVLLAAALVLGSFTAAHATSYGSFKFTKSKDLVKVVNAQGLTVAAPKDTNIFGIPSAAVPVGTTTMVMQFDFRSTGFFAQETGAHIPIMLMGKWENANPSLPANPPTNGYLIGRGISIGNLTGHPQGCSVPRVAVIESFRPSSNALYTSSCSAGGGSTNVQLNDNTTYHFVIYASNTQFVEGQHFNVIYSILNNNNLLLQGFALDLTSEIPGNLGGWGIGEVLNSNINANWTLEFNNINVIYE